MIDTIIYDKNSQVTGIALLKSGEVKNIEIISGNQAISGNVYLGKITKKFHLLMIEKVFLLISVMEKKLS